MNYEKCKHKWKAVIDGPRGGDYVFCVECGIGKEAWIAKKLREAMTK